MYALFFSGALVDLGADPAVAPKLSRVFKKTPSGQHEHFTKILRR